MGRIRHFYEEESWGDFLNVANYGKSVLDDLGLSRSSRNEDKRFTGSSSYRAAQKLAEEGWPEGRKKMEEIKDQITEELISIYPKDEIPWIVTGKPLILITGAATKA